MILTYVGLSFIVPILNMLFSANMYRNKKLTDMTMIVKNITLFIVFIVFISFFGLSCAQATSEPRTLYFACGLKEDHKIFRHVSEMMNAILPTMGFQFKMSYYPGKRALRELENGKIDGFCAKSPAGFANSSMLIAVPTPIGYSRIFLYGKATQSDFTGLKDTDKLIYVRGTIPIEEFIRKSESGANAVSTTSIEQALKMIIAGRADYFVEFHRPAVSAIKNLGVKDRLKAIPISDNVPIYLAIHRRHQHLKDEIDRKFIAYLKDTYGRDTLPEE